MEIKSVEIWVDFKPTLAEELLIKSAYDFIAKYRNDIDSDFTHPIVNNSFILKDNITDFKKTTITDLSLFFMIENLSTIFPDIFTATIIFMTIPVISSSAERSFSKLKLLKNYLRNTMSQDRLSSLAILNIERLQISETYVVRIINTFANAKSRKMNCLH
ncbi:HAT, C-terminal dimerisation domain [Cinara cedri]|uniref:HAT, C-terminal dimerisation domain n=1 Tax=Cinara cedri TaxID=506608 RepID=A0A5E4NK44_9HEMI|nr:HAT, C-terminal dimerisation domain [Cinara cedri]